MNEQIKGLRKQACEWARENASINQYENASDEKFAELLIRECAKFLNDNSGYDECNNSWHPEPEDLLKHFNVI